MYAQVTIINHLLTYIPANQARVYSFLFVEVVYLYVVAIIP